MRESQIERYFVEQVQQAGGLTRKVCWIGRRGCPDRFWSFPGGEYGFAELKATGEVPRPEQEREFARLRALGVTVLVFDSFYAIDQWMLR